jgi:DNA-directed RNA polymerase subunit M/transcription elongation factor TFIIS
LATGSAILQDSSALRLLYRLASEKNIEVTPKIDGSRIFYPLLEEVLSGEVDETEFLSKLHDEGFLVKKVYDKIYLCPSCGSADLRPRLQCPSCSSINLARGEALVHYHCGYVDFVDKFMVNDSTLKCPKCGRILKQVGIDYGEPGQTYRCLDCQEFFYYPVECWVCKKCNYKFKVSAAMIETVYSFEFNEEKRDEVDKVLFHVKPLAEALEKLGFKVKCFQEFEGNSGSKHVIDIYAVHDGGRKNHWPKKIIIDIEERNGGKHVTADEFFKFISKVFDLREKNCKMLLVAIPKLEEEAKKVSSKLGVAWIEAKNIVEAAAMFKTKLNRI